ncbi:Protein of unknown function [Pyronema omphalodes CBS 100304]|uniref:Uncharacterized protein n=1 Tax=Pyronema omphalodes (strain CBS 100304) TaxID=1076935 RepID=U4LLJ9_PYROM|nr:Protein of unknown function [Pyronema omphalodes CBS 100304]
MFTHVRSFKGRTKNRETAKTQAMFPSGRRFLYTS